MKKKVVSLFVLGAASLMLISCGNTSGKPEDMNEEIYNYGVSAVETTEEYLNADITADDADNKMDTLEQSANSIETDEMIDKSVQASINLLAAQFRTISYNSIDNNISDSDLNDLQDARDDLKETLNME